MVLYVFFLYMKKNAFWFAFLYVHICTKRTVTYWTKVFPIFFLVKRYTIYSFSFKYRCHRSYPKFLYKVFIGMSVASLGGRGAARFGCHHFGLTLFYNVFDFLFQFIGSQSTYAAKIREVFGEDLFFMIFTYFWTEVTEFLAKTFFWSSLAFGPKTHWIFGGDLFFSFWSSLPEGWHHEGCVTRTGWHHALPPRVSPSLATPLPHVTVYLVRIFTFKNADE